MNARTLVFLLCLGLGVGLASSARAQDATLTAGSLDASLGGSFEVPVNLNTAIELSGFSYGLCDVDNVFEIPADGVAPGADLDALGVDFFAPAQAPLLSPGNLGDHTVGCVVSFSGMASIPVTATFEATLTSYTEVGGIEGGHDLCFCDTLGTPLVVTTVVDVAGAGQAPITECGTVNVMSGPPAFLFNAPTLTTPGDGTAIDIQLSIADTQDAGIESQGFSYGLAIDAALTLNSSAAIGVLADTNGGSGPDFFGENLAPDNGPGYTVGVVVSFAGMDVLTVSSAGDAVVGLNLTKPTLDPMDPEVMAPLTWTDTLGMPVVINGVVVGGSGVPIGFEDGVITITPPGLAPSFRRGDCNDDGIVNIADGINVINEYVSGAGPVLGDCDEACDANGDGMGPDLADAVYIINYRFLSGAAPPAPFPGCGDGDPLTCNTSQSNCP